MDRDKSVYDLNGLVNVKIDKFMAEELATCGFFKIKKEMALNPLKEPDLNLLEPIGEDEYLNDFSGKTICYGAAEIVRQKVEAKFGWGKDKTGIQPANY